MFLCKKFYLFALVGVLIKLLLNLNLSHIEVKK